MIKMVKQKICSRKLKHVIADIADLREFFDYTADIVFVFNQALQLVPFTQLNEVIDNMNQCRFILLDLYDFNGNSDDFLSYYDIRKGDGIYYKTSEFRYKDSNIIRYSMSKKNCEGVEITYKYVSEQKIFFSKIFLYYFNFQDTIKKIELNGNYKVKKIFSDYKGNQYNKNNRFILLLERRNR